MQKRGRTENLEDYNLRIGAFLLTHMRVARCQYMSGVASREEVICDLTPLLAVSAPGGDVPTSG
jgi:hypothetical protein